MTAGRMTFDITTPKSIAAAPTPTIVAPMSPPNRACDELDGRPSSQVSMFQVIAPMSPAKITAGKHRRGQLILVDDPARDRLCDLRREEGADEVQDGGQENRHLGLQRARRDGRRHRIRGVVEPVREVEEQCQCDHQHDHQGCGLHRSLSVEGIRGVPT